jgi:hypothetical protein
MARNYYITLEVHDEGEWPRIAPENLMQHVEVRLPAGLTLAGAKVTEQAALHRKSGFEVTSCAEYLVLVQRSRSRRKGFSRMCRQEGLS